MGTILIAVCRECGFEKEIFFGGGIQQTEVILSAIFNWQWFTPANGSVPDRH